MLGTFKTFASFKKQARTHQCYPSSTSYQSQPWAGRLTLMIAILLVRSRAVCEASGIDGTSGRWDDFLGHLNSPPFATSAAHMHAGMPGLCLCYAVSVIQALLTDAGTMSSRTLPEVVQVLTTRRAPVLTHMQASSSCRRAQGCSASQYFQAGDPCDVAWCATWIVERFVKWQELLGLHPR